MKRDKIFCTVFDVLIEAIEVPTSLRLFLLEFRAAKIKVVAIIK